MSRFFASADSSSGDELDHEDADGIQQQKRKFLAGSSSSDELMSSASGSEMSDGAPDEDDAEAVVQRQQQQQRDRDLEARRSRFLVGGASDSDSSDDGGQRVVKSGREKVLEEVDAITTALGDAVDEDAWTSAAADFERLVRAAGKAARVGAGLPDSLVDFVEFLADVLQGEQAGERVKKLKADEARAFNSLRQKFKKFDFEGLKQQAADASFSASSALAVDGKASGERQGSGAVDEDEVITAATVPMRLQEIMGSRGKRRAAGDRAESVTVLRKCLAAAGSSVELRVQVLIALLSCQMDVHGTLTAEQLTSLIDDLTLFAGCLEQLKNADVAAASDAGEGMSALGYAVTFASLLTRIDDELSLAVNSCDHHSPAYIDFARVELRLVRTLNRAACTPLLSRFALDETVLWECRIRLLDRVYYRPSIIDLKQLLVMLYGSGIESVQMRAVLCHSWLLASNGNGTAARQLLADAHIQEHIGRQTPALQILYNRSLVALGIAAFRAGRLFDAYTALQEVCASGRPKELLGQGMPYHHDSRKDHGQGSSQGERAERLRLVPHHLHVNLELIDTVFSITSMLVELPQSAAQHAAVHQPNPRKVFQSRHLKRILDGHERSLFNGPPENGRETIVAACRALAKADWRQCRDLLVGQVRRVWHDPASIASIEALLEDKVKRSSLLFSLYTMAPSTVAVSVGRSAAKFNLSEEDVRACFLSHQSTGLLLPVTVSGQAVVDLFKWRDSSLPAAAVSSTPGQQAALSPEAPSKGGMRRDAHYERTIAHLRDLALPLWHDDPLACEYIFYGSAARVEDLFNPQPEAMAADDA